MNLNNNSVTTTLPVSQKGNNLQTIINGSSGSSSNGGTCGGNGNNGSGGIGEQQQRTMEEVQV